jgi:hypothetical protein
MKTETKILHRILATPAWFHAFMYPTCLYGCGTLESSGIIRYPVSLQHCVPFSRHICQHNVTDTRCTLPDTIETRYAFWYVTYIDRFTPFDIRGVPDDLIALLVHARDTGETWALEDYLTEAGIL